MEECLTILGLLHFECSWHYVPFLLLRDTKRDAAISSAARLRGVISHGMLLAVPFSARQVFACWNFSIAQPQRPKTSQKVAGNSAERRCTKEGVAFMSSYLRIGVDKILIRQPSRQL